LPDLLFGNMVVDNALAASVGKTGTAGDGSMSALYGAGGDVANLVAQSSFSADAGKQFVWSANEQFTPVASSFDATAASLGLTPDDARRLMAADNGASIVGSPFSPAVTGNAVPYPQISVSPLPESGVTLAQTEGGFWRGLSGDRRSVFESTAPLSEKIGAGVRAVGEFIADPFIEVGNQYRDLYAAANGATGGWSSGFAQQVSAGSYGAAALTEFGAVAGTVPLAGAAVSRAVSLAPAFAETADGIAARNPLIFGPRLSIVPDGPMAAGGKGLLPTEGNVGTYNELIAAGGKGDNITPHHIPSANYMSQLDIAKGDGISMNMEQPFPGVGGRHRETFTYGTNADLGMSPRGALAAGVWDARQIYQRDGLYSQIRPQLQELIRQNKAAYPDLFGRF
jgi:hypothetical protein